MKLLALLRLILNGHMLLLLELVVTVSEGATLPETTLTCQLPIPTHLYYDTT